ncbi:MAG: TrlF family ATPase, partial [Candidatus Hodarchaeales archaeon]
MTTRGSGWRKWDLHVHTPASFQHSFKMPSGEPLQLTEEERWDYYIEKLEEIQDIVVIGITDYFSLDGYNKVLEYKKNGRLHNFELILPNIELRLDTLVPSRKKTTKKINYHVIFSNEISPERIQKDFLERIEFDFLSDKKVLTRANIEEVGRHLKDSDQDLQGKSDFKTGCIHISIPLDNIISVLKKQKQLFEGKYILVLPDDSWNEIHWKSHGRTKRAELYAKSHAMFASNPNTINWALGKLEQGPQNLPAEFRSIKPCFHGSDAHDFERLCKPDLDRFCWIKADRTFEGLKQVIYEPEERVRIQKGNPEPRKNIWTLSSVTIRNSQINRDLAIAEQEILLNPNLIAVIGGKGTGKTALLELVAHCFEERRKSGGKDKNSFIQRIEDEKSDLAISIDFLEEEQFSKEIGEPEFFLKSKITYLPQGRIEAYSGNRQKLHRIITDTIFYDGTIRETPLKDKYEHLQKQVKGLEEKLRTLTAQIIALEDQVDPLARLELEKAWKFREGERRNKLFELGELEKELKTDLRTKVKELRREETKLVSRERRLREVLNNLSDYLAKLEEMRMRENKILKLAKDLERFDIHIAIPHLKFDSHQKAVNQAFKVINDKLTAIQKKIIEQRSGISQLAGFEEEYDNLRK